MPSLLMKPLPARPAAVRLIAAAFTLCAAASCGRPNLPGAPADAAARSTGASIAAGDAARLAANGVDPLLAGKTPAPATQNFFSVYDNAAHAYTRNPACFAARLDTTCLSVGNSANADGSGGSRGCVTMITPLHGLTNHHFGQPYQPGVVHYFVDRANTVHARTVVKAEQAGEADIEVVTFDSPLPAAIRPAQLLPAGAVARLLPAGTPLLATNQQKQAVVTELAGLASGEIVVRPALAPGRRAWTASPPAVLGDSDCPTFVLFGARPVLLFTYHTNVSGPDFSASLAAIKALLNGPYALDVAAVQ